MQHQQSIRGSQKPDGELICKRARSTKQEEARAHKPPTFSNRQPQIPNSRRGHQSAAAYPISSINLIIANRKFGEVVKL
jgi:cell envelope opacity-associated protein A